MKEKVCLGSKLYSIDYLGGTKQSAKGVQKSVKKTLYHSLFKNCLISKSVPRKEMTQLRSVGHQVVVKAANKVNLSLFDGKRYILDNTVSSLAYRHYSLGNPKRISSKLQIYKEKFQQTKVRNVLFCLVDIDSISEADSSTFGDDDDDGGFDSDSVISTASNQNQEAQTSSNISSLFVNNDGPLAKA